MILWDEQIVSLFAASHGQVSTC